MRTAELAPAVGEAAVERRAFLWALLAAVAGALAGEWCRTRWKANVSRAVLRIDGAADLPPGGVLAFTLPGSGVSGLLRRSDLDAYVAFDRRCTHLGCPVLWEAARGELVCPCHRGAFDARTGEVLAGPPRAPLRRLTVVRRGAEVWVESTTASEA
jgi:Rieske Fe-S protein